MIGVLDEVDGDEGYPIFMMEIPPTEPPLAEEAMSPETQIGKRGRLLAYSRLFAY